MPWQGRVYFVSDRDGTMNLWSMDAAGRDLRQHTRHAGWDAAIAVALRRAHRLPARRRPPRLRHRGRPRRRARRPPRLRPRPAPREVGRRADGLPHRRAPLARRRPGRAHRPRPGVRRPGHPGAPRRGVALARRPPPPRALPARRQVDPRALRRERRGRVLAAARQRRRRGRAVSPRRQGAALGRRPLAGRQVRSPRTTRTTRLWSAQPRRRPRRQGRGLARRRLRRPRLVARQRSGWPTSTPAPNLFAAVKLYEVATGRDRRRSTSDRYDSYSPAWSPDGKWLYFLSDRNLESLVRQPLGVAPARAVLRQADEDLPPRARRAGSASPFQPDDELQAEGRREEGGRQGQGRQGRRREEAGGQGHDRGGRPRRPGCSRCRCPPATSSRSRSTATGCSGSPARPAPSARPPSSPSTSPTRRPSPRRWSPT